MDHESWIMDHRLAISLAFLKVSYDAALLVASLLYMRIPESSPARVHERTVASLEQGQ
jgi:hypothetical protein